MKLLKDWKELLVALGAMTVAAVVLKVIQLTVPNQGRETLPVTLFTGWLLATGCGEALWLAWGASNLFWRLIVVGLGALLLCAMWEGVSWLFLIVFSTILLSASVLALPRIVGIRRCRLNTEGMPQPVRASRQFSIRDVFVWTTCFAFLLGIASWTDFFEVLSSDYEYVLQFSPFLVVCGWAAMWAVLAHRDRIFLRLLLASLPPIATLFLQSDSRAVSDSVEIISVALSAFLIVCGGLYILRRKGIRFATCRGICERKFTIGSSASADISPFDANDRDCGE
jgi:hypothetical protein